MYQIGTFKNFEFNGQGKEYGADESVLEEGEFRDDLLYNGTLYLTSGKSVNVKEGFYESGEKLPGEKLLGRIDEIKKDREIFELRAGEGEDYQIQYYAHSSEEEITYKGKYLGEMKSGKPNGLGVFAYVNPQDGYKELLIGEWKNGVFEGEGETRYYQPEYAKERAKDFPEEDRERVERQITKVYDIGTFKNFELNGQGKEYGADESVLQEGEFRDDSLYNGTFYFPTGETFEIRDGKAQ